MRAARQGTRRDRARGVRRGGGGRARRVSIFFAQTPRRNGRRIPSSRSEIEPSEPSSRRCHPGPSPVGEHSTSSARRAPSSAATNARIGHSRGAEARARRSRVRARASLRAMATPRAADAVASLRSRRAPSCTRSPLCRSPISAVSSRIPEPQHRRVLPLARGLGALAGRDGPRPTRAREAGVARSPRRVRRLDQREARAPGVRGRGQTPRAPRREAAGRRGEGGDRDRDPRRGDFAFSSLRASPRSRDVSDRSLTRTTTDPAGLHDPSEPRPERDPNASEQPDAFRRLLAERRASRAAAAAAVGTSASSRRRALAASRDSAAAEPLPERRRRARRSRRRSRGTGSSRPRRPSGLRLGLGLRRSRSRSRRRRHRIRRRRRPRPRVRRRVRPRRANPERPRLRLR